MEPPEILGPRTRPTNNWRIRGEVSRARVRTGGHGGGDSGEDEEEGEDQLPQHGADAAGVDDDDVTLVERIRMLGVHARAELHEARRSGSWDVARVCAAPR